SFQQGLLRPERLPLGRRRRAAGDQPSAGVLQGVKERHMQTKTAAGADVPVLGFGTWELREQQARTMVAEALALGYRHIDTAQLYRNEAEVGQGLQDSGVTRDDIFLTTKVWPDNYSADRFLP